MMSGDQISVREFRAACVLLGVPPTRADDVVDIHVAAGKVVLHLVFHDDQGMMIITKHDGSVLQRVEVDIVP
jgi:hypothetical protein